MYRVVTKRAKPEYKKGRKKPKAYFMGVGAKPGSKDSTALLITD